MFDITETILNRIVVFVKKPLDIDRKYAFMFHGSTHLMPGRYYYCFPSTNVSYCRKVTSFRKQYKREVEYQFAYGGLKEM